MSRSRRAGCASLLAWSFLFVSGCSGDPPNVEIQRAQTAIDQARAAGAERYARDELVAAEASLKSAHDAVTDRDYRLALTRALDSRDRAETAARQAADEQATARQAATRVLATTDTALSELTAKLKGPARGSRISARAAAAFRATIANAQAAVQEARASLDAGDYQAVTRSLDRVLERIRKALGELGGSSSPASKRTS